MFTNNTFLIYNASAGSGKTYTLVKTYLSLLLGNSSDNSFRHILAITFTNKAAAEMKLRILENLHDLSLTSSADAEMKRDLCFKLKLTEDELAQKAQKVLKNLLHNYRDFSVSTIDAFTVKVVRTFAPDLRLSYRFNIELDTDSLFRKAIDLMYNELKTQPELTDFLVDFSLQEIDEDRSWDISQTLFKSAQKLTYENSRAQMEKVLGKSLSHYTNFLKTLQTKKQQTYATLAIKAKNTLQHFYDHELSDDDFTRKSVPNFFRKIQENPKGEINFTLTWIKEVDTAQLYNKNLSEAKKQAIEGSREWLKNEVEEIRQYCIRLVFIDKINRSLRPLAVLDRLKHWYDYTKTKNRLLPLFEANQLIWEQVRDQEAPFIYERLGQKFLYYFIDEFQDTSRRQWENLFPLTTHTLSVSHGSSLPGLVMLVGDAKQSIYSWRGGDPEQFINLCRGNSPYALPMRYEVLENNYRSREEIVTFNNDFFSQVAPFLNPFYREIYQKSVQQNAQRAPGGYVRIDLFSASNVGEKNELHPQKVFEIVKEVQGLGYALSDICVLVRKNDYAYNIAKYLAENEIPVVSAQSLLLTSCPEVNFLMHWLEAFQKPDRGEYILNILYYFVDTHQIPSEKIHAFISDHLLLKAEDLWSVFGQSTLTFAQARSLNLYEWAEAVIAHFKLCPKANPYLSSLMDYVLEYSIKQPAYSSAFIEIWKENVKNWSLAEASGCQAVQVMTIHKSKGLQFPVIIYAYADDTLYDRTQSTDWFPLNAEEWGGFEQVEITYNTQMISLSEEWAAREQELKNKAFFEAFNHIYVAQTRAEEQLYILSSFKENKGNEIKNQTDLYFDYLKSIQEGSDKTHYEFGQPMPKKPTDAETNRTSITETWIYRPAKTSVHAVASQAALLWSTQNEAAVEKGKLWHRILAEIYTETDLLPALSKVIDEGLMTEKDKEMTRESLTKIIRHENLHQYFSAKWQILNERSLLVNGALHRPDRVVLSDQKAVVIDYKTGKKKLADEIQIQTYVNALKEMGYEVEGALLVYLKEETEVIRIKI